jgi:DNA-binding response OmpR family regulator
LFAVDGTDVTAVATLDEAKRALGRQTYELIVTDLNLAGKRDGGLQVMAAAGLLSTDAPIIVLTAFPDESNRSASHRLGAIYFLDKPADVAAIATLATVTAFRPRWENEHQTAHFEFGQNAGLDSAHRAIAPRGSHVVSRGWRVIVGA